MARSRVQSSHVRVGSRDRECGFASARMRIAAPHPRFASCVRQCYERQMKSSKRPSTRKVAFLWGLDRELKHSEVHGQIKRTRSTSARVGGHEPENVSLRIGKWLSSLGALGDSAKQVDGRLNRAEQSPTHRDCDRLTLPDVMSRTRCRP